MTTESPGLDKQIACAEAVGGVVGAAILASLRRLKRMEELLREPSAGMIDAYFKTEIPLTPIHHFTCMSAALLAQVDKEMKDD